jgi:galactokinase/mevalonate kinase-like predicted kinase
MHVLTYDSTGLASEPLGPGGTISGAGGGFMFFFAEFDRRHHVAEALRAHGAEPVDFGFSDARLQTRVR